MKPPDPLRSHAVLIGVSQYDDPQLSDRPALATGAHRLGELLRDPTVWGLPSENCTVLTGERASLRNLRHSVKTAADRAGDDGGALVVYYGGHGTLLRTAGESELRLAAVDSEDSDPLEWWRYNDLKARLGTRRDGSAAPVRVLLLDCCYSGHATHSGHLSASAFPTSEDVGDMSALYTASSARQVAEVPEGSDYSAYAGAVIGALEDGVAAAGRHLNLGDLHRDVRRRLLGHRQQPQFIPKGLAERQPLFTNRSHRHQHTGGSAPIDMVMSPKSYLTGRDTLLDRIQTFAETALSDGPWIGVIHGRAGLGKTEIARATVARLRDRFPDARIEINLHGWTPGQKPRQQSELLESLLHNTGSRVPSTLAARQERWRTWLAGRKVILVVDNAADARELTPLLPAAGSACAVLVTSRSSLPDLDADHDFAVPELTGTEAVSLLRQLAGPEPSDTELHRLADAAGRTPLALSKLGCRLRRFALSSSIVQTMGNSPAVIPGVVDYQKSFALSIQPLGHHLTQVLYACGRHPGPDFGIGSIAAMTELARSDVTLAMSELSELSLLQPLAHQRHTLHDLDRFCTTEAADHAAPDTRALQHDRLFRWLLATSEGAGAHIWGHDPDADPPARVDDFDSPMQACQWLSDSTSELRTAVTTAVNTEHPRAAELAAITAKWLRFDDQHDAVTGLLTPILANDRPELSATALKGLADIARTRHHHTTALQRYNEALSLFRQLNDHKAQGQVTWSLGEVARARNQYGPAHQRYSEALLLFQRIGDRRGAAYSHLGLAELARFRNHLDTSLKQIRTAFTLFDQIGDILGQAQAHWSLGNVAAMRGDHRSAADQYRSLLELCDSTNDRRGQALARHGLGEVAQLSHDLRTARFEYQAALDLYVRIGDLRGQARIWYSRGRLADERQDRAEALMAYHRSRDMYRKLRDLDGEARCTDRLDRYRPRW